ncbi:transposase [Nonomuraea sp. NN258]|uniref:transposase n=1 Tax=Nonomuraea antri TaxID=2730852 RepID=UPI001568D4CF|nr:transposase [Nonomuraea antri]NRQ31820.1 transposase [Nonomuraea antri]
MESLSGSGRRDVPERYGPWSTVYSRFNGWAKALIAEAGSRVLTLGQAADCPRFTTVLDKWSRLLASTT